MDKKDIMYGVAAIAIILVMAVFVKPVITGQPVNTGIPVPATTAARPDIPPDNNRYNNHSDANTRPDLEQDGHVSRICQRISLWSHPYR
ncbi:hypothetical protein [Methanoregula sp. PtaB.Bin085]|uniref:hypothetical protein n=1 Tax=Methanoregula sp. PtaB.Bin085 TaxID=1811680 RepID=UPI0009CCF2FC|nr:hypothetical protein [Methanoregula sp. PtaB.Bin085]OPX62602.1 MAG: hypothetical protein A4E33_02230 [Methanoregula sp. PtaB.Bin085]